MPAKIHTAGAPKIGRSSSKKERDKFYASAAWRKLRLAFLREHPLCMRCLPRTVPAAIVHHVRERLQRPDLALEWDNLEALCDACHTSHHNGVLPWHADAAPSTPLIPTAAPLPALPELPELEPVDDLVQLGEFTIPHLSKEDYETFRRLRLGEFPPGK